MRDGSHAVSHSYTEDQVRAIAGGLDDAGVGYIELTHGDGLNGSSYNYGFSKVNELDLLRAARPVVKNAKLGILMLPGVGTIEDLEVCMETGIDAVRVATHCTEADVAIQHIKYAKSKGLFTVGFLMMVHMISAEELLEQAKIFDDLGVDYVNLADSSGHMLPHDVSEKVGTLVKGLSCPVGYHAHNNMALAMGNTLAAIEAGASYVDVTCRGLGAGAGNCQGEVLASVLDLMGYETGIDIYKLQDVAEEIVEPLMHRPQTINTSSLMLGYAGVYSSFLLHAYKAAERFDLNPRDILAELGRRKMVGGQEDMIVDVAYEMSQKK